MKASLFNIFTTDSRTQEVLLFNSLYGSVTVWDKSEFQLAERILKDPAEKAVGSSANVITDQLIRNKYLVEDDIDEMEIVTRRKLRGIEDSNRLDIVVMPNMTCNFACPYCYESHQPSAFMKEETERSLKRWLTKEVPKFKVLFVSWFGGEPLLSYGQIVSVGRHVRKICEQHNVGLLMNITTNGYLLNETRVKELTKLGFLNYQFTVDGPPDVHNRTRILKNGKGTFARIFRNIMLLLKAHEEVLISLRVNFNHTNLHSIPELLRLFPDGVRPRLKIVYEPIFGEKCLSATDNIPSEEISSSMIEYYRLAKELGYDVTIGNIGTGKLVYCFAERENQFVFNYNGDIFKCTVNSFGSEARLGHLNDDGLVIRDEQQWDKWVGMPLFEEKCKGCKFLPICMGGCRKSRLEHGTTGSFCNLVPTNTSFALKEIAFGKFDEVLYNVNTTDSNLRFGIG